MVLISYKLQACSRGTGMAAPDQQPARPHRGGCRTHAEYLTRVDYAEL